VADERRTVVIGGTSEEYIAALKAIAGPVGTQWPPDGIQDGNEV